MEVESLRITRRVHPDHHRSELDDSHVRIGADWFRLGGNDLPGRSLRVPRSCCATQSK